MAPATKAANHSLRATSGGPSTATVPGTGSGTGTGTSIPPGSNSHDSRRFGQNSSTSRRISTNGLTGSVVGDRRSRSFAEADDYSSPSTTHADAAKKKLTRSTTYATPLSFIDEEEILRKTSSRHSTPLTREALESLQAAQEAKDFKDLSHSPLKFHQSNDRSFDDPNWLAFMRKTKSDKKPKKKYKDKDVDTHPLNLPPEELKRLSARLVARDEKRYSQQSKMDTEMNDYDAASDSAQPYTNGSSQSRPSSPSTSNAPGAFPTNGNAETENDARETRSPTPPPHKISPKMDPEACKAAGNKFFKAKDYDRAITEYSKAVDAEPSNPIYLSNRAAAYISAGKFDQALTDSLKANSLDPDNEKILHRLARIYTSLGRPEAALTTYSKIPNASATDTAAAKRAMSSIETAEKQIYADNGDGKMALWSIDQAKQTLGAGAPMPRNWQILRAKANLKIGSANALGEVTGIAQSLMRDNPQDAEAVTLLGRAYYLKDDKGVAKSDYQRAEECFRRALGLDPDNSDARNGLKTMKKLERAKNEANELYKNKQWDAAVNAYSECLNIDTTNKITNAKILGNRAMARSKLEQFDLARSDCDQALKLDPTYTKAKRTRAKITGESGDWDQAVKDLKALVEDNPSDAEMQKELRNAELELKKSKRKDWYKILGVSKDAGDKEIERAYKKKAAVLHPDKTQGDKEKEEQFKDCLEAKETLLDPQKRQIYDSGADLMEPGMGGMGGHPFGGFGGMGGGMGGGVQIDPEMLFNMMGGMGGAGGGRGGMGGGFPGGFSFSSGGPGMGGQRGGFPF